MTAQEKKEILAFIKLVRIEQDRRIANTYADIAYLVAIKNDMAKLAESVEGLEGIDFNNFVVKDGNKQLSTNDFTDAEKALLLELTNSSSNFTEEDFLSVFADD